MTLECARLDWGAVRLIREEWDALVAAQPFADPTRRLGWLEAWWGAFGHVRGRRAVFVVVRRGGRLVGAAPLMVERLPGGIRLLRHLGTSPHWFDPEPSVAPGDGAARTALAAAISQTPADLVVMEDLRHGDEMTEELRRALPGAVVRLQDERQHRFITDDPPAKLKRRRRKGGQRRRSLERAGRSVDVDVTVEFAAIEGALDEVADLVDRAWRERGDGSGITHPAGRRYLRDGLRALSPGGAQLVRVRVDGRLAAFDLTLREGRDAVMFRGSWDPASGASGIGWVSMLAALDGLLEDGCRAVDFGKFGWKYKQELTSDHRPELATVGAARGVRGYAALLAWRARPRLLRARQRLVGRLARIGIHRQG